MNALRVCGCLTWRGVMNDYLTIKVGGDALSDGESKRGGIQISDVCTGISPRPITEVMARRTRQSDDVTCSMGFSSATVSLYQAFLEGRACEGTYHVSSPTGAWTLSFSNGYITNLIFDGGGGADVPVNKMTISAQQWSFNNSVEVTKGLRTPTKK